MSISPSIGSATRPSQFFKKVALKIKIQVKTIALVSVSFEDGLSSPIPSTSSHSEISTKKCSYLNDDTDRCGKWYCIKWEDSTVIKQDVDLFYYKTNLISDILKIKLFCLYNNNLIFISIL